MKEEAKAHALVAQGYDGSHPDSDAYSSIFFQNANNSVRVTDDFMYAVVRDTEFSTRAVTDGSVVKTYKAKEVLRKFPKPPGTAAIPACNTTPRSTVGTRRRTRPASTPATPAANTCSWTTQPATWPA